MEYKGYVARVVFDESIGAFHGRVENISDVVTFEATTVPALYKEFKSSLEDYFDFCAERGEEPEKPYSGKMLLRLDPELHGKVAAAAAQAGSSVNAWVADVLGAAVAEYRKREYGAPWEVAGPAKPLKDYLTPRKKKGR